MSTSSRLNRPLSSLVLACFLPACVTTHIGSPTELAHAPIKVSCSYSPDIQTKSMSGLVCVLENLSPNWQDLKIKSLRFPDQSDVTIVAADDMRTLAEAYELKQQRENNNVGLALGALVVTGALVAAGSSDTATSTAGSAAMLGGVTASAGRDIKKGYDSAQYGPAVYGREHLLGGGLRIPPDLSIRRQVVINHPTQKPKEIEICWDQPQNVCSLLRIP